MTYYIVAYIIWQKTYMAIFNIFCGDFYLLTILTNFVSAASESLSLQKQIFWEELLEVRTASICIIFKGVYVFSSTGV